jgi:hypothetical protein
MSGARTATPLRVASVLKKPRHNITLTTPGNNLSFKSKLFANVASCFRYYLEKYPYFAEEVILLVAKKS